MLVRQNQNNSNASISLESNKTTLWKTFVGPLVAALIAGAGAFIGMQREMSVVTNSVNRLSTTMEKVVDKQTTFFESFYVPLAIKVEQQGSAINGINTSLSNMKEEMRYAHSLNASGRGYNANR